MSVRISACLRRRPAGHAFAVGAQAPPSARLDGYKQETAGRVDEMAKLAQEMVDSVFSFSELGFQEVETSRYLTGMLEKNGFSIRRGVAGMPTAWVATWGSGRPVIALGSDIDGIPQASQKPGVSGHSPLIEGAPGHGEGHNTGVPLNIIAALAVKRIMERDKLPGTLVLWPGVAEELLASKAWFVREGVFKDVDVCLFAHVGSNFDVAWGSTSATGLVSVQYTFSGETAHSAGAPDRGRSALDAVELMNAAWNFKREHLRIQQRSHYVITDGGDQPNVVPARATVWYYFRETDYPHIKEMWDFGNKMAEGASLMTGTTWTSQPGRHRLAAALQQAGGRGDVRQRPEGRPAAVERRRSAAGQGRAAGGRVHEHERPGHHAPPAAGAGARRGQARRRVRRHRRRVVDRAHGDACGIPRTSPACPATTGRARWPAPRPSRTRAWWRAPRSRR